jgi:Spy/CpxP family protein refolding chaperone
MKKQLTIIVTTFTLLSGMATTTLLASPPTKKFKPFLIQGKLPHLTKMVKMMWDDKDLALTQQQKAKLLVVRKETVYGIQTLKKQIMVLENKIVRASNQGIKPAKIQAKVEKLASLRAQATMLHLNCLYNTKKILTQEQLDIIE